MKKTKLLALVLCLALAASLFAGCSGTPAAPAESTTAPTSDAPSAAPDASAPAAEPAAGEKTLFLCPKSVGFDYWTSAELGAKAAGEQIGYNVVFNGPSEVDSAKQINMIEDMLTKNIAGLAAAPNDAAAVGPVFDKAIAAGVPTITFDTDAPTTNRAWYVGPDSDYSMGQQIGEMMGQQMGGEGELAFMVASLGAENQIAKVEGAESVLKEKYPNIQVVTTVVSDDDNQKAFANAQNLLSTYPNLKGILGFAGAEAPQAAEAVTQAIANGTLKEGQIQITGIGFPSQCRPYVKSGILKQVLSWDPNVMGQVAVHVLAAMDQGKTIDASFKVEGVDGVKVEDKNVYSGCLLLDSSNIDQYNYS